MKGNCLVISLLAFCYTFRSYEIHHLNEGKKLDCNYSAVLNRQMAGSQSDAFDMTLLCQVFMRIMVMYVRTGRGKKGSKSFRTRFLRLKVP